MYKSHLLHEKMKRRISWSLGERERERKRWMKYLSTDSDNFIEGISEHVFLRQLLVQMGLKLFSFLQRERERESSLPELGKYT